MHIIRILFIIAASCVIAGVCVITLERDIYYRSKPIQIVTPVQSHSFESNINELNDILSSDKIKDRDLVVVSVTGAFRKGKSFLINFFLRYLHAQYKLHDITDWVGRHKRLNGLNRFVFRSERTPETSGIWMWSEVFTHDYSNGRKIAIMLMDAQEIVDLQPSKRGSVFAISTLLSSMQCYNLFHNIEEDDLNSLKYLTDYAHFVHEEKNTYHAQFQYLLLIMRDWSVSGFNYGWSSKLIAETLEGHPEDTREIHSLRKKIEKSFQKIHSFLLPYPGENVARTKNFTGNTQDINPWFVKYAELLVTDLLAPENLVVKGYSGRRLKAQHFSRYLVEYVKVFSGDQLPPPITVYQAAANVTNQLLGEILLDGHSQSLLQLIERNFNPSNFIRRHDEGIRPTYRKWFLEVSSPRNGGDEASACILQQIEDKVQQQLDKACRINEDRYEIFVDNHIKDFERKFMEYLNSIRRLKLEEFGNSHLERDIEDTKEIYVKEFVETIMPDQLKYYLKLKEKFHADIHVLLYDISRKRAELSNYNIHQIRQRLKWIFFIFGSLAGFCMEGPYAALFGAFLGVCISDFLYN